TRCMMIEKVNLSEKFRLFREQWSPKIAGEVNESFVKLVKFQGPFVWHKHDAEDEMFLVVKGSFKIMLRDGEVELSEGEFAIIPRGVEHKPDEGEFAIIPRGVEHKPVAEEEAHV